MTADPSHRPAHGLAVGNSADDWALITRARARRLGKAVASALQDLAGELRHDRWHSHGDDRFLELVYDSFGSPVRHPVARARLNIDETADIDPKTTTITLDLTAAMPDSLNLGELGEATRILIAFTPPKG